MTTTLDTGAALLRAILLDPADDDARLVYADWLEEQGEWERASLIRRGEERQVRYGGMAQFGGRVMVGPGVWEQWFQGDIPAQCTVAVRGGFVERIELPTSVLLDHASALFSQHPITEVRLTDRRAAQPPVDFDTDETDGFYWQRHEEGYWPTAAIDEMAARQQNRVPLGIFRFLESGRYDCDPVGNCNRQWYSHGTVTFSYNTCGNSRCEHIYNRIYDTEADALAALSAACVRYGRQQAGLE